MDQTHLWRAHSPIGCELRTPRGDQVQPSMNRIRRPFICSLHRGNKCKMPMQSTQLRDTSEDLERTKLQLLDVSGARPGTLKAQPEVINAERLIFSNGISGAP